VTDEWEASLATHRAQQRTLIQRAAVDLATERGLSSVGMVDVARRAGISRATLYKYFSSVEAVLASFMIGEVEREHAALGQLLSTLDDPLDRLHAVLVHLLEYFSSPGHLTASTVIDPHQFSPEVGIEVGAAMQRLHDMVRDQIVAAVDEGALRSGTDVGVLADVFQHLLTAGRTLVVDRGRTPASAAEVVWTQFLHGAAAPT
jgi:AcrR family transcriptional regulator